MSDSDKVFRFRASFPPPPAKPINFGDGGFIKLDIPETDIAQVVGLVALRGCRLIVTIELDNDKSEAKQDGRTKAPRRRAGKRGVEQSDTGV